MNIKEKFWVATFISLWVLVSTVSTIHSVEFFGLSNNIYMSWCLAIGFEIGAMASLGGILISKGNKTLIWMLFIILTLFQIHGNMYWAWSHASDISEWTKLFDLVEEDPLTTKRIFSFISGGILPLVSLGFIKSLMDYLKPIEEQTTEPIVEVLDETVVEVDKEIEELDTIDKTDITEIEDTEPILEDAPLENVDVLNTKDSKLDKLNSILDSAESTINSIGQK